MKRFYEVLTPGEGMLFASAAGGKLPEHRERYRAWLAERGDERAELFTIEDALLRDDTSGREAMIARAQEILSRSQPVREWWEVVSRSVAIRNCGSAGAVRPVVRFAFECPRTWETLSPTVDPSARHCSTCQKLVHLCRTRHEAEQRARRGECITITRDSWLEISHDMTKNSTGRPDPVTMWADRVYADDPLEQ